MLKVEERTEEGGSVPVREVVLDQREAWLSLAHAPPQRTRTHTHFITVTHYQGFPEHTVDNRWR